MIQSIISEDLVAAMDANLVEYWSAFGLAPGRTWHRSKKVAWFYTGISAAILNGVLFAQLSSESLEKTVKSLAAKIAEQGVQAIWWISPASKPPNIGALLEEHGLQPVGDAPAMAIDLSKLDDKPQEIPHFRIIKVDNPELEAVWAQILNIGMGFSEDIAAEVVKLIASRAVPLYQIQHLYVGFVDDEPVATSAMLLDSGLAGIYAVATLPQARRRGIGKSVTVTPLIEARNLGYRVGILQSSQMGHSLYEKIGFVDVFKYANYLQS